ncbi:MAG: YggS family pyridoxal phosphate-dependent enzyme [Cyclobacteriaceae bacterium]
MNSIKDRLAQILSELPTGCTLVAVSKTKPDTDIMEAWQTGHRHFGENKVQELVTKAEALPKDIHWHMIGHLQRNKVKYIASFVHLIHGVDTIRLLKEINKQGEKNERTIDCLMQVHIASEETKFGFSPDELSGIFSSGELAELKNVKIRGLMGMATNTTDTLQVEKEFKGLKKLYEELNEISNAGMNILSMGMSGDYTIAIKAGSNMVRIGSSIFGSRNY